MRRTSLPGGAAERPDARLAAPAAAVWLGTFAATGGRPWLGVAVPAVLLAGVLVLGLVRARPLVPVAGAALVCLAGAATVGALHVGAVRSSGLGDLAAEGAVAELAGTVTGDPVVHHGGTRGDHRTGDLVVVPVRVERTVARGRELRTRAPVVVLARDRRWAGLLPGQRVSLSGRLGPARAGQPAAAVVAVRGPPVRRGRPPAVQRLAGRLRSGLRVASSDLAPDARGLLPGLVVGDTSRVPASLDADFRIAGMTHLVAVSGANLAIVGVLRPSRRPLGRCARARAAARGRRRDRRVRRGGAPAALGAARRRDGRDRAGRAGDRSSPARPRGPRRGCGAAAARGPVAGPVLRLRPLGARDRRSGAAGTRLGRGVASPRTATPAGGGAGRRPGRPARLRARRGAALRTGQPGRRAREPAGGTGRRAGHPARRARPGGRAGERGRSGSGGPCGGAAGAVDRGGRARRRGAARGGDAVARQRGRRGSARRGDGRGGAADPGHRPTAGRRRGVGRGARRGARRPGDDAGLAARRLAAGCLRRGAGRRAGAGRRSGSRCRRGRRAGSTCRGPLPPRARRAPGAAGAAHPPARRPRRGTARRAAGPRGGRARPRRVRRAPR